MKRLLVIFLTLLLAEFALCQEFPIEIELTPPKGVSSIVIEAPLELPNKQPEWNAPAVKCQVCQERAVRGNCQCYDPVTRGMARRLLGEVKTALGEPFRLKRPVNVRVVSRQKLAQLGGERLLGLYEDDVIYISSALNRRRARAVIAHEYGHAWHFHHRADIDAPSELFFEGFAEFVSYLALSKFGDRRAAERILVEDKSIYGRGARKFHKYYQSRGLDDLLKFGLRGVNI